MLSYEAETVSVSFQDQGTRPAGLTSNSDAVPLVAPDRDEPTLPHQTASASPDPAAVAETAVDEGLTPGARRSTLATEGVPEDGKLTPAARRRSTLAAQEALEDQRQKVQVGGAILRKKTNGFMDWDPEAAAQARAEAEAAGLEEAEQP